VIARVETAASAGINFYDTADIFGLGHSEDILGETIRDTDKIIYATKVGNVARNDQFTVDYSKEYIMAACEASLKRLRREVIDYYQLHSARLVHLQNGECIEAMQELQRQGKIRYWGLSLNSFDPTPEAEFLIEKKLGNGFQLVLNILNQRALPLIKKANQNGYGIIARMPLQFGLLTGKFNASSAFASNDHRHKRLSAEMISTVLKVMDPIWKLCDKYGINKTQLALSYVLSYPGVSTVIPGIRTASHVLQNTTGLITLDAEDMQMIEEKGRTDLIPVMQLIERQG